MPEHPSIGINAGPLFGALGLLAGVIRARETGEGCQLEIAQSDAAAAMDWLRSETWQGVRAPGVRGHRQRGRRLRAARAGHRGHGRRRALPVLRDEGRPRAVHGVASASSGRTSAEGIGRADLFERWPGSQYADHARGNTELREILRDIFATRTTAEWLAFGLEHNTPIAPSNTPKTLLDDPQFRDRMPLIPEERVGADMLPTPIKFVDEELPVPTKAPTVGEHTEQVLREVARLERRADRSGTRRGCVRKRIGPLVRRRPAWAR